MTTAMDMVNKINPEKEAWNLKVRVIRLWIVPTFTGQLLLNSIEMILVDESECKIQATIRKTMIYRTTVRAAICDFIPKFALTIFPFTEILETKEDSDFLVDVVGLMVFVSEEKEYDKDGKKMKMAVMELAENDYRIRCALFDEYVNEVNRFLSFGRVGLQNVIFASKLGFNLNIPKVTAFRKSSIPHGVSASQPIGIVGPGKNIRIEEDFMKLTPRFVNLRPVFICILKKSKFRMKVLVEDSTNISIFVLFDREASYILNKTCAQLFEQHLKDVDVVFGTQSPPIFQEIVGKTMLFKVLSRPVGMEKFKGTYPVMRVCDDAAIVGIFELSGSFGKPSKVTKSPNLGLTPSSYSELFVGLPQCTQKESSVVDLGVEKDMKPSLKRLRKSLRLQFDEADESRGLGNDGSSGQGVN
ncbi:uncharacterized protein LOC130980625 [Arachis stenosperma]|uniref:uncharacterized protein LOC130980625 n=1 Tax=Arachis stenosperma TaxID=217475 RepID=UPI0025AD6CB4|nr:uncharacterized protein LOC130980625 [Arachis stenosperma]